MERDTLRDDAGTAHSQASLLADLEPVALAATRAAALACEPWIGRGSGKAADAAATEAMRAALAHAPGLGTVIVGEGAKDDAPMLFDGERLGANEMIEFDIAVDPLECTTLCAKGLLGSLATIAFAAPGTMASIAVSYYMDKLVGAAELRGALDLAQPLEVNLQRASVALRKPVSKLRVVVLDKPRHVRVIERLHDAGATVMAPPDGDVAGALEALLPDREADLLMGVGGTPEGIMIACAARALGGCMQARLAPQRPDEAEAIANQGLSTERVYELEELAASEGLFVATGVTGGTLLRRPWHENGRVYTESLLIVAGSVRRVVEARPGLPAALHPASPERAALESSGCWPGAASSARPANPHENGSR